MGHIHSAILSETQHRMFFEAFKLIEEIDNIYYHNYNLNVEVGAQSHN